MPYVSLRFLLMLGYAVMLAGVAFLLERTARHAHRRSLRISTVGFTYHPERDIWHCPEEQHLFPVFTDWSRNTVVYQAQASTCNACKRKEACTDSNEGRQIERHLSDDLEYGMQRFHRVLSITLLILASSILIIDLFEPAGLLPRISLVVVLMMFLISLKHLVRSLLDSSHSTSGNVLDRTEPSLQPKAILTIDKGRPSSPATHRHQNNTRPLHARRQP